MSADRHPAYPATQTELAAVRLPIREARTLPPSSYYSPDAFAVERWQVFLRGWRAVLFSDMLDCPGDVLAFDYLDVPLLAVRDGDDIRLFHNVVPYDGCPVQLGARRGAKELVSAYHGLVFGLDGILSRAPWWDGNPKATADAVTNGPRDLIALPVRQWGRLLFADFGGGGDFGTFIAPLAERAGHVDFEKLAPSRKADGTLMTTPCIVVGNWKTHHENACINVFHEASVHAIYRRSPYVPRIRDGVRRYREICDRGLRGLAYSNEEAGNTYLPLPFPELPRLRSGGEDNLITSFYPNLYVSVIGPHVHLTLAEPAGSEDVRLQSITLYDASVAADPETLAMRELVEAAWDASGQEDHAIVAAIQRARRSPAAQPGFFAPFWDRMHHDFLNQLVDDLERTD
jgi:choline monooxygenase